MYLNPCDAGQRRITSAAVPTLPYGRVMSITRDWMTAAKQARHFIADVVAADQAPITQPARVALLQLDAALQRALARAGKLVHVDDKKLADQRLAALRQIYDACPCPHTRDKLATLIRAFPK
jgi:hypothetical protein